MRVEERRVDVPGGRVFVRIVGGGPGTPLLALHGGPGAGLISIDPLKHLGDERPVVFYDQLGCGRSDCPSDRGLWTLQRFVDEIDAVRSALALDEIVLYGHSWGGMLAIEYLLGQPPGVRGVVLSDCMASLSGFLEEAWRLVDCLPAWPRRVLHRRAVRSLSYQVALLWFRMRHVVRLQRLPDLRPILWSLVLMLRSPAFHVLWGGDDLHVKGSLAGWERADRLHEIDIPALVIAGEHDETTPRLAEALARGLPRGEVHVFEGCSHLPFFERPRAYLGLLRRFMHQGLMEVAGSEKVGADQPGPE